MGCPKIPTLLLYLTILFVCDAALHGILIGMSLHSPPRRNIDGVASLNRLSSKSEISNVEESNSRRDVLMYLSGCFTLAVGVSTYEDFECSLVRPKPHIRRLYALEDQNINMLGSATKGLGQKASDNISFNDDMPTYNDIMLQHREQTVPRWKELYDKNDDNDDGVQEEDSKSLISNAAGAIYNAIDAVYLAADSASDYDWDGLEEILRSSVLQQDLADACSVLRFSTFISKEGRDEIGFDWGSCAWRHCGARADAQEAIAELIRDAGMLEPYECLYILDIVLRSLNEILAVIPISLHPEEYVNSSKERISFYTPKEENDRESYSDKDYEGALSFLRNTNFEDSDK